MAIYHGMERGEHLFLRFQNGFVDPFSFDPHSEDFFIQDLYELASNDTYTIELSTNNSFQHKTENGIENKDFESTPMDVSDYDIDDSFCEYLKELGLPFGRTVQGNLGRAIFPVKSKSQSIDSHIHIVINAKGRLNHRTIGLAHEFGHVLLFLRGKPYQHPNPEADSFIYGRATMMSKRLGYDY